MVASHLPPELLEEVFGFLADEAATLRACALVHRSWTRGSQCQLFQTIDIASPSKWTRLRSLLKEYYHIRPMLRHVVLHYPLVSGSSARPHPDLFPQVIRLTYSDMHFETAVLDNFPALCALEFGEVSRVIENAQAPLRRLESLSITCRGLPVWNGEPVLSWIHNTGCSQTLRELEVVVPGRAFPLPILSSVLQSLGVIQKLKLNARIWRLRADLALGQIYTPRLIVYTFPDEEALPVLIGLLQQTTFVGLRRLELLIDRDVYDFYLNDVPCDNNGPAFDPFKPVQSENVVPLEHGCLEPALAGQLEEVIISLPWARTLYQASRFLTAFGEANRPGVPRFLPSTLILKDDPLP